MMFFEMAQFEKKNYETNKKKIANKKDDTIYDKK